MKLERGAHDVTCPYCGRIIPAGQLRAVTTVGHGVVMRRAHPSCVRKEKRKHAGRIAHDH
jgi:hypothetical protein